MTRKPALLFWLASLLAGPCLAEGGNGLDNPDWQEEPAPPAPALSQQAPLPLAMPHYISSKVAVDPASIAVGKDGVVRYVLVVRNGDGLQGAVYEGIRCVSDEVKTYARMNASGAWTPVAEPQWKPLADNSPSRISFVFARQGGCQSRLATSPQEIIRALQQSGPSTRKGGAGP